ncbi:MAG TPA: helix-turn-helix transcriptional regulator, partial [Solirubrobacterales bacterium]|nr:helix-turn-helix transcriptional regulator [Solirubrobacterales bacterium]
GGVAAKGGGLMATYRRRVKATFDQDQGVFMISVAAELAEMHPQTLRMYEQRGLIAPKRSPKNTRLYSQRDVERLRRIQEMTAEGLNLAGVEMVLALESQVQRLRAENERLRKRLEELEANTSKNQEDGKTS